MIPLQNGIYGDNCIYGLIKIRGFVCMCVPVIICANERMVILILCSFVGQGKTVSYNVIYMCKLKYFQP